MDQQKTREAFNKEFDGALDARTKLHENFSKQGTQLIGYRKKIIEIVITVSAAFIAAPVVFRVEPNPNLYHIGLLLLIFTVIFSLLHLREHVDADEAKTVMLHNKLVSILDRRIEELKKYLVKTTFDLSDIQGYQQFREREDYSEEMKNLTQSSQKELSFISKKAMDYTSCLIMFLFTSGAFFIITSILFQNIHLLMIILIEILLLIITATNFAGKLTTVYAKIINFLKS